MILDNGKLKNNWTKYIQDTFKNNRHKDVYGVIHNW